jgi:hypothetical protein
MLYNILTCQDAVQQSTTNRTMQWRRAWICCGFSWICCKTLANGSLGIIARDRTSLKRGQGTQKSKIHILQCWTVLIGLPNNPSLYPNFCRLRTSTTRKKAFNPSTIVPATLTAQQLCYGSLLHYLCALKTRAFHILIGLLHVLTGIKHVKQTHRLVRNVYLFATLGRLYR